MKQHVTVFGYDGVLKPLYGEDDMFNIMRIKQLAVLLLIMFVSACGGGGGGGGGGSSSGGETTKSGTTISGKVFLSQYLSAAQSSKASSPSEKMSAYASLPKGKPGSKTFQKSLKTSGSRAGISGSPFFKSDAVVTTATVWLYDSDHPEWLYPVAASATDDTGAYTLTELTNAQYNLDADGNPAYTDGDPIPEGNYTLLAFTPGGFDPTTGVTTKPVVAVQTIVNEFVGDAAGNDLVAQNSSATPTIEAMFGQPKNTDGTQTWGSDQLQIPANAAIQVNFSMAMSRGSISSGISISPNVDGNWAISADWLSATFYPEDGAGLQEGETYTVTVNGSDGAGTPVTNVYGNPLEKTATGTFTVPTGAAATDTQAPNVSAMSPEASQTDVDVATPVRIVSSEVLDVNKLLLSSTPSVGAKPGVIFIGEDGSGGFIYEFMLAEPLKLGTQYDVTITGGTDMAGNEMAELSYSFTTAAAGQVEGIDVNADETTQSVQADVRDVFGRWVRAFNERNLTQLQSLMLGDFIFEYSIEGNGIDSDDLNRDGRYDLDEFSSMIEEAFVKWDFCGTQIDGKIVGNINVDAQANEARFEFTLTATSEVASQECAEVAPPDSLFASVTDVNGGWLISRMSQGIDTLDREIAALDVIPSRLEQMDPATGESDFIPEGGTLFTLPARDEATGVVSDAYTFGWDEVEGASSYAFIIFNANEDWRGRAYVLPSTMTKWVMPFDKDPQTGKSILPSGVSKQHDLFGFTKKDENGDRPSLRLLREGEEFMWTVMAMGTKTVADFESDRVQNPFDDIIANAPMSRYKNPGELLQLSVNVLDEAGVAIVYNELFDGYDAGNSNTVTLQISTPNLDAGNCCANVNVYGAVSNNYPVTFDAQGQATITVDLGRGYNWIDIYDGIGEFKGFNVQTTGGIAPPIEVTSVSATLTDASGAEIVRTYTPDSWGFVDTSADGGAKTVTISGSVSDPNITEVNINMGSDIGAYIGYAVPVNNGAFETTLDIYTGNNWIGIDGFFCDTNNNCNYAFANVGVYSSDGTPYEPPISNVVVTEASLLNDWGNGADWDASADADNTVEITGLLQFPNGTIGYDVGSDGAWNNGTITPNPDGSFVLSVELYNGNNWVNIYDDQGNWYSLSIFTSAGKTVVRPVITTVNGNPYDGSGIVQTDACTLTIDGLALADREVNIYWNGDDGAGNFYSENFRTVAGPDDGTGLGAFSVTVPVIGGFNAYNSVNINDANFASIFVNVETTDGTCEYIQPVLETTGISDGSTTTTLISDSSGMVGVDDGFGGITDYDAGASGLVTLSGTSTGPGRAILVEVYTCGGIEQYEGSASTTANASGTFDWSVESVSVYQGATSLNITDGVNYQYMNVLSTTVNTPVPVLDAAVDETTAVDSAGTSVTVTAYEGMCGYASYDAGAAVSLTITGTTTGSDGTGSYWDSSNTMQTFDIVNGAFSFEVNLYDGNNYFFINDADYNNMSVEVFTTNGNARPQVVTITSPLHNDVVDTTVSTMTVAGTVDGSNGFVPSRIMGYIFDEGTGVNLTYSSDPFEIDSLGYLPIVYDSANGGFSFDIDTATLSDQPISISVNAREDATGVEYGHAIFVNNIYNYGEYAYKPGVESAKPDAKGIMSKTNATRVFKRSRMSHP